MTYTYAILDVSKAAYTEVRAKLDEAGYQHAFHHDEGHEVIDMHGIALRVKPPECVTCNDEGRHVDEGGCPKCRRIWPGAV